MAPIDTYPPEFVAAVQGVLLDEGGYVCNPDDPGGATKFGISKRSYPDLDIENLTREEATAIYYRDFWVTPHLDLLPAAIAAKILNLSADVGSPVAIGFLQKALSHTGRNVAYDGVCGPETAAAAKSMPAEWLLTEIRVVAAHYYRVLAWGDGKDDQFLEGWLNRAYQ